MLAGAPCHRKALADDPATPGARVTGRTAGGAARGASHFLLTPATGLQRQRKSLVLPRHRRPYSRLRLSIHRLVDNRSGIQLSCGHGRKGLGI